MFGMNFFVSHNYIQKHFHYLSILSLFRVSFSLFIVVPFCWKWWPEPFKKKKKIKHKNQFYAICQWRALPRFEYDVFGGCPNVCLWICIRNVYGDGIVLSIYCPSKILNVLKVSVLIHHQHHHRHNSVIADTVHSHTDIILSYNNMNKEQFYALLSHQHANIHKHSIFQFSLYLIFITADS